MLINPVNLIKISSQKIAYKGQRNSSEGNSHYKNLKSLQRKLQNSLMMLQQSARNPKKPNEPTMLEYQIEELMQHINYISEYLSDNDIEPAENIAKSDKNILMAGFTSKDDIISLEMQARMYIEQANLTLGIEPAGRDIVIASKKNKQPKPFDLSDKLLVLDEYQNTAVKEFRNGNTVMVTAPTGTGKTLIAEHIIDDILKSGKKVIYTTPLKALCNDKYKQFSKLWGDYNSKGELIGTSKIGLATGDAKINVNAPLVVMTTEIYRNMLVQQGEKAVEKELKDVDAVIFDEFHYMGDEQRGSVWEESVMFSPERMKFLMLSATVSNANPLKNWVNSINTNHEASVIAVPEEERYVPLKHYVYAQIGGDYNLHNLTEGLIDLNALKTGKLDNRRQETLSEMAAKLGAPDGFSAVKSIISKAGGNFQKINETAFVKELVKSGIPFPKALQYSLRLVDKKSQKLNSALSKVEASDYIPIKDFISDINFKNMTPALYFTYSKKNCKALMKETSEKIGSLLNPDERAEIKRRISNIQQKGIFLGTDFESDIMPCLLNGFAMHHSGMMPQCKSFIEELGRSKLVKVCFATDTLGAGINFPFKTVVFSDFEKYGDYGFEEISVNSFKQGAGRAGRRGIDDIGYVISIPKNKEEVIIPYNKVTMPSDEIQSAFRLSYGLILSPRFLNNSLKILNKSFDNYQRQSVDSNFRQSMIMQNILKQRKMIEHKNNKYILTPKGKIASKVRGINEILLAEILTDTSLMENITPSQLAELISVFAPEKEDKLPAVSYIQNNNSDKKLLKAVDIAQSVRETENENGIESNIIINSACSPFVRMWINTEENESNSERWSILINDMLSQKVIKNEGDFLKKINYTINILKQIKKIAPTPYISDVAAKAVKMLQKSPVNDILLYELDYKENNE